MSVKSSGENKMIAKGLVPIPFREDAESGIIAAMKTDARDVVYRSWNTGSITDRDGGFFDNLASILKWAPTPNVRRVMYETLRVRGDSLSPYHSLVSALDLHANLVITGLLVEVADRPSPYSLSLGATALVARKECASDWRLTATRTRLVKESRGSQEAKFVNCAMDELVGLALATKLPVVISENLYGTVCVDGLMEKATEISVSAPTFSSRQEETMYRRQMREQREREDGRIRSKMARKASELPDASTYLQMSVSEKRACLRASGVTVLPRPREGVRAVDALLIPLLDEEVAYEILRRLAETKGDFEQAAEMEDFQTRKPVIARQIREARQAGDYDKARALCDELNNLAVLRFDPTVVDGPEGEWDVEEWYWEQRKRVYGIIAA